jgi:hypothetical protein
MEAATRRRRRRFEQLLRRLRLRQKSRREKRRWEEGRGGGTVAAGDKQLGSCAAGKMNYMALSLQWQVNPRGDLPSASSTRWP